MRCKMEKKKVKKNKRIDRKYSRLEKRIEYLENKTIQYDKVLFSDESADSAIEKQIIALKTKTNILMNISIGVVLAAVFAAALAYLLPII